MELKTIQDKVCYGIGRQISNQFAQSKFEGFNDEAMIEGLRDGLKGAELPIPADELNQAFDEFRAIMEKAQAEQSSKLKAEGEKYLADNAKKEGVITTTSGLQYEVLTEGTGDIPGPTDVVKVHYQGNLISGKIFDSSYQRNQPAEFPVNGVIAGWTEALQLMKVGSKLKLSIPYNLAYGEQGAGSSIPPYATLIFEVELLDIVMKANK